MNETVINEVVNTFLQSTVYVLKVQAGCEAKATPPVVKAGEAPLSGDISGVIGLVSNNVSGNLVISFPAQTFLSIVSKMLGDEFKELSPDLQDGASEVANMILGRAKVELNQKGHNFQSAIPTVVMGGQHSIGGSKKNMKSFVVNFESTMGPFVVDVRIQSE